MTRLVYLQSFTVIQQALSSATYAQDPANPLRLVFSDPATSAVRAQITFFAPGGTVTRVLVEDGAGNDLVSLTGLSVPRTALEATLSGVASDLDLYQSMIGLMDDATTVTGSALDDLVETGAGDDSVEAGAGNDTILKWSAGDISADGGAGIDRIQFSSFFSGNPPTTGATLNLTSGVGLNPFGGTLALTGIENVTGTALADTITGSAGDNVIGDGAQDGGADVVDARGGNDTVWIAPSSAGKSVNGGAGTDTLFFTTSAPAIGDGQGNFTLGRAILDLLNPAANTGDFTGMIVRGFEVFAAHQFFATSSLFVFRGSNNSEEVRGVDLIPGTFLPSGRDQLFGRGGNDRLDGLSANDLLDGGTGDDLIFGGAGADTLRGGDGADRQTGGGGADLFVYLDTDDSIGPPTGRDAITDFLSGTDRIDLSAIDAIAGGGDDAFTWRGAGTFTAAGQVRAFAQGGNIVVQASTDADAAAELVIVLEGISSVARADFIL